MGLREYVKKRNFKETSEPKSGTKKSEGKLKFVVQRHHASHLHYDFRLELEGVLKSWAVPKGPSLNPKDKRLAMMVEDHPYDYRTFEGTIPAGNYGAGHVTIFDEGTYESLSDKDHEKELKKGLYSGNLKFRLHGNILRGEFALVKLKDAETNSWLLIKHRDEFATDKKFNSEDLVSEAVKKKGIQTKARAKAGNAPPLLADEPVEEQPEKSAEEISYKPMLAKLASSDSIPDDDNWIYERKLDGYRALAFTGKKITLVSRNGINFESKYAPIEGALKQLKNEAVIDGEIVAEDEAGNAVFQALQNYGRSKKGVNLKYYVFDLLFLNGHDLRELELLKRKELLKALVKDLDDKVIVYNEHVTGKGTELMKLAAASKWEGIIGKEASGAYLSDRRSDSWLKYKLQNSQEAVIIGYSKPAGSRKYFGSLVLGMYQDGHLQYIGNCGTGFNEESLKDLYQKMIDLGGVKKPVAEKVHRERDVTWVKPLLVCEVTYSEWTADKHLRHPVFKGLRSDKSTDEVKEEIPLNETKPARKPAKSSGKEKTQKSPSEPKSADKTAKGKSNTTENERIERFGRKQVKLTNLNKLYWKKEKITKGQLLDYYREMADYVLPYLKDRPLSLNRHPNGADAPGFFQKDLDVDQIPSWIKYAVMHSESNNKDIDYLVCNDVATLLWMVNLGCIEINPWLSTHKKPENPIFAVMDLDPNDVDDFKDVVKVALTAKEILGQMGVTPYIKTSGSRGLHIFIHVGGKYDYEVVKNFIHFLGQMILQEHPDITSLERSPSKRKKKIYLDFLQNRRGQTIASPYSARPKPGATVSTPLDWDEVNEDLDIKQFTIFNTAARLKEKGDLWKDITKEKTDLKAALEKLQ